MNKPDLKTLFIGGGGYTMPRYVEEVYPQSSVEVIEIDPEVTNVAFNYLGLRPDTRIVSYDEDARMRVPKLLRGSYDLVVGDAFNDVSVPYHLTTREFNEQIKELLSEDGIYMINVVDKLHSGTFARSFVRTLQETFPHVSLFRDDADWANDGRKTHVIVASSRPIQVEAVRNANIRAGRGELVSNLMPEDMFNTWLGARKSTLLTDNYAPVDNLLASIYLASTGDTGLSDAVKRYNAGVELDGKGKLEEAKIEYDEAIRLDPTLARAYVNRGSALNRLGLQQQSIIDYTEALRLIPEYAVAFYDRGISYMALQQYPEALEDLNEAVRLDPSFTPGYLNRASVLFRLGRYSESVQDWSEAIWRNPDNSLAYASRALVYTTLGQDDLAQKDFDRAVELGLDPDELRRAIEEQKQQP